MFRTISPVRFYSRLAQSVNLRLSVAIADSKIVAILAPVFDRSLGAPLPDGSIPIPTIDKLKEFARALQGRLGGAIGYGHCLEAIAAAYGLEGWNHATALCPAPRELVGGVISALETSAVDLNCVSFVDDPQREPARKEFAAAWNDERWPIALGLAYERSVAEVIRPSAADLAKDLAALEEVTGLLRYRQGFLPSTTWRDAALMLSFAADPLGFARVSWALTRTREIVSWSGADIAQYPGQHLLEEIFGRDIRLAERFVLARTFPVSDVSAPANKRAEPLSRVRTWFDARVGIQTVLGRITMRTQG